VNGGELPDTFKVKGATREAAGFAPFATKDYSRGAVPTTVGYRGEPLPDRIVGYAGYKPQWRATDNPLNGGKAIPLSSDASRICTPGYAGFRPGENSEPFVDGQDRPKSMAQRIAQRRLEKMNSP